MGRKEESNVKGNIYRFIVTNVNLVTEHNTPLAYAPGVELHHLIVCNLGGDAGRLEK